jgi:hypothetical protein
LSEDQRAGCERIPLRAYVYAPGHLTSTNVSSISFPMLSLSICLSLFLSLSGFYTFASTRLFLQLVFEFVSVSTNLPTAVAYLLLLPQLGLAMQSSVNLALFTDNTTILQDAFERSMTDMLVSEPSSIDK